MEVIEAASHLFEEGKIGNMAEVAVGWFLRSYR